MKCNLCNKRMWWWQENYKWVSSHRACFLERSRKYIATDLGYLNEFVDKNGYVHADKTLKNGKVYGE